MDYPTHIYDPIRVEVANAYIKREMRKYLPSVRTRDVWKNIDRDIDQWFENNQNIAKIRDYWNGFHGIAMGFKLKNGLTIILAEKATKATTIGVNVKVGSNNETPKILGISYISFANTKF